MTDQVPANVPASAPPGWYMQGGRTRWWDGHNWGDFYVAPYKPTNHVFHLLMSIITVGLWIPVWIIVGLSNARPRA